MASPPPPSPRRPLPQPIEETQSSNRSSKASEAGRAAKSPSSPTSPIKPRRALPQPVESSSKSSRKGAYKEHISDTSRDFIGEHAEHSGSTRVLPQPIESSGSSTAPSSQSSKPSRKFAPQVIETSRRSRRNTSSDSDSSDLTPLASPPRPKSSIEAFHLSHHTPSGADHIATQEGHSPSSLNHTAPAPESRFSSSKLAERTTRRHSFRVPDLPAIPSITESNDSSVSSADEDSDSQVQKRRREHKQLSQTRESQDETTSGYLLSLAARAAEKQLKEQVMAAYPNENLHEQVDHYAGDRDSDSDEESGVKSGINQPSAGIQDDSTRKDRGQKFAQWQRKHSDPEEAGDLAELRRHGDKVAQQKKDVWESQPRETFRESVPFSSIGATDPNAEFRRRAVPVGAKPAAAAPTAHNRQAENELKSMAKAASPPMAGQNLRFPRCQSPDNTRLDVHQYPGHRIESGQESRQQTGLWTPKGGISRENSKSGLWMGVNAASAQEHLAPPRFIQTGLITPAVETGDPFSSAENSAAPSRRSSYVAAPSLPPSPPSSQEEEMTRRHHVVKKPRIVTTEVLTLIEEELDDAFVTQVYNYLSLGYPSLARPYDEELAKISQMDVATLRADDLGGNSKGYIGAPEGTGMDVRGCREGACQRWLALKKYVLEWGRQQALVKGVGGAEWEKSELASDQGGWGARARKGSWAI